MFKIYTVFRRRPDMTRAQFRSYYEDSHVPLALANIGLFGFYKYVRNHVIAAPVDPGFDCLTEFYFPDAARARQAAELLKTPAGQLFAEDKPRFIDMRDHPSFGVEERILAGPPRTLDPLGIHKQVLVLKAAPGASPEELVTRATDYGQAFARSNGTAIHRLSMDIALRGPGFDPPYDVLLTMWPQSGAKAQLDWANAADWSRRIEVETFEPTPAQLGIREATSA